jgi:hypothetical protein
MGATLTCGLFEDGSSQDDGRDDLEVFSVATEVSLRENGVIERASRLGGPFQRSKSPDPGINRNRRRDSRLLLPPHSRLLSSRFNTLQCSSLVNCDVVGLLTLYEVLRFVFRGVVHITFETDIGDNFPKDHAANSSRFRVPFNTVTALECLSHLLRIFSANCV